MAVKKKENKPTDMIGIRVPRELKKRLEEDSEQQDREFESLNQYYNFVFEEYFKWQEFKKKVNSRQE